MQWLRNLPVSRKFIFAFGIVCGLCIVQGAYSYFTFHGIAARSAEVSGSHLPSLISIGDIRNGVSVERREDLEMMLCAQPACTAEHAARRQKAIAEYQSALKEMEPLAAPAERNYYLALMASINKYQDSSDRGIALLAAGKAGDALDLLSSVATIDWLNEALTATNNGVQLHAKIGTETAEGATGAANQAIWINLGITLLMLLLCALTGMILTREIAPRLNRLKNAVEAMAAKDLTASIRVTGTDEIGQLGEAFNSSVASMREVLQAVAQGADTLSAATTEISARSVESAGNARAQSSKTNQIAAAAQEMTATIGEISHNAEIGHGQPRLGRNRQPGRRGNAGRGRDHGKDCRRHQLGLRQDDLAGPSLRGDRQGGQRDSGDQRTDQPAGPECGH